MFTFASYVSLNHVYLFYRDEDDVTVGIFNLDVVLFHAVYFFALYLKETPDTVGNMYNIVSGSKVYKTVDGFGANLSC